MFRKKLDSYHINQRLTKLHIKYNKEDPKPLKSFKQLYQHYKGNRKKLRPWIQLGEDVILYMGQHRAATSSMISLMNREPVLREIVTQLFYAHYYYSKNKRVKEAARQVLQTHLPEEYPGWFAYTPLTLDASLRYGGMKIKEVERVLSYLNILYARDYEPLYTSHQFKLAIADTFGAGLKRLTEKMEHFPYYIALSEEIFGIEGEKARIEHTKKLVHSIANYPHAYRELLPTLILVLMTRPRLLEEAFLPKAARLLAGIGGYVDKGEFEKEIRQIVRWIHKHFDYQSFLPQWMALSPDERAGVKKVFYMYEDLWEMAQRAEEDDALAVIKEDLDR
ncbi:MAG: hypothetical protein GXN92_01070 [Candidatus Micrarchaeota archaeon]|nr:hypothetical protein [Candidatus Micrarchaeota archaeon]